MAASALFSKPYLFGTDNTGTGTTDLTGIVALPDGCAGAFVDYANTAMVNNTATSWGVGIILYDAAGNVMWDLTAPAAADRIQVVFTGFTTPFGAKVAFGPTLTDKVKGGTAVNQGITLFNAPAAAKIKVQRFVLGGALTSLTSAWTLYTLWDKVSNAAAAAPG